jgi:epidermal growth factor receptor substrate 15
MSSSFSPTPGELALTNAIFAKADTQKLGILTGDVAVEAFSGSKLAPTVLGEIWGMSDKENQGFLTRKQVAVAVRLMGWAQKGEPVSEALIDRRAYLLASPLARI